MGDQQPVKYPLNNEEEEIDPKKEWRRIINLILPDSLMIVLAGFMVPIVLIPLFVRLPESIDTFLKFSDYVVLSVFVIEYVAKVVVAPDTLKHVLNPWHLLDLLVVVLPFVAVLPVAYSGLSFSSPLLRLLRIVRVLAAGGRAVDRRLQLTPSAPAIEVSEELPMLVRVMDGTLENIYDDVPLNQLKRYLDSPAHTWIDISSVSEVDINSLSEVLKVPRIILESELVDEAYPRIDYFGEYSLIFARIPDLRISRSDISALAINRTGLLVICQGANIISMCRGRLEFIDDVVERAKRVRTAAEPLAVSILYGMLKYVLEKDRRIIAALEHELMALESIPVKERPSNFLEKTFYLRKEVNQLVPSLLHLKEVISVIASRRVPLHGFNEKHAEIFDILADEAAYLQETASNARENLLSLIDLHINTTSYQINRVMRLIAVITSMSIIPAVLGLLGSNLVGNPWDIHLWQVFALLGTLLVAMGWVFYRLGWLKW